jgi:hypothetical protein
MKGITRYLALAATTIAGVAAAHCGGSSSPSSPTTAALAVSGVTLNSPSLVVGATAQGTVSLMAPPPTAVSVALTSSNAAVATVQTPVTIQPGSSSATFVVTAMASGTTAITASLNGSSRQSPTLTVTGAVAMSSILLSASSIVGGSPVTGTATLSAGAPPGGAVVQLSAGDPVTVPASVTVPPGSTSVTFSVSTRAVGGSMSTTISGSYGGTSASATLSVTRPTVATASFGVTGPAETDTCTLANGGNTLNCTFDGSASTAPGTIVVWEWVYGVATTFSQTTSGPQLTMPGVNCSLLPPPPLPMGNSWFTMTVALKVQDNRGNSSKPAVNKGVRVLPQGACGY